MVQPRWEKTAERKGQAKEKISQNSRWLVVGGRDDRFLQREVTNEKMEEGEQQLDGRPVSVSLLLYRRVFFPPV